MKTISLNLKRLHCQTAVAPLSLCCRSASVAPAVTTHSLLLLPRLSPPLSFRSRSAFALLSFRCCSAVAPLSIRCRSAVAQLSLSCRSAVALLLLLSIRCHCCRFCYRYTVPADIAPAVTQLSLLLLLCCCSAVALVSLWCHSAIFPLSVCYRPVVAPLPLLSLLLALRILLQLSLHCCCLD